MNYGRAPWPLPEQLTPEQAEYYDDLVSGPRDTAMIRDDQGRLLGAFNARLLDPPVGAAIQKLGAALRFGTTLTARQREIIILEVARSERCSYEWHGHSRAAKKAGMTDLEIRAILTGADCESFDESESTVARITRTLVTSRDLDDALFAAAAAIIGLERLFDLVSLVGHYQHTALAIRVWRVPLREGDAPVFDEEREPRR